MESSELSDFVGFKLAMMKETQGAQRLQSRMAGFVCDMVMSEVVRSTPYLRTLEAVVFVTDISGFTTLTEMYTLKGKGGTEQLTRTLAGFIGPLAECTLQTDGDIMKFAGDAFISIWQVKKKEEYQEVIQKVIDCAMYCQEKYGSFTTDVGTVIRVKIGIACGRLFYSEIGNSSMNQYVVYGPAVSGAGNAEHHCESGDIVLHESVWQYCDQKYFVIGDMENGFCKLLSIIHFVNPSKRGRPMLSQRRKDSADTKPLRACIASVPGAVQSTKLRKFILPTVLKNLDDDVPWEFLNESRMVSIAFMHVKHAVAEPPATVEEGKATMEVVQTSYTVCLNNANALFGCVTKIVMFDKGLTFLVVFGLPGYTSENITAAALKFSHRTLKELIEAPNMVEISIGVTTGPCYCGILGHPLRHEYTVIGKRVNEAARLMCNYPGIVSCSHDTVYNSRLPPYQFHQLEAKVLKGVTNIGKIYQFHGEEGIEDVAGAYIYPILGRRQERLILDGVFQKRHRSSNLGPGPGRLSVIEMKATSDGASEPSTILGPPPDIEPSVVVIEGVTGSGKSRFLARGIQDAETYGWKVYRVTMSALTEETEYVQLLWLSRLYALTILLTQAFGLDQLRDASERETKLRDMGKTCTDKETFSELSILNDILQVKFPPSSKFSFLDHKSKQGFVQRKINQLLRFIFVKQSVLFAIEDAHFLTQTIWEYIQSIAKVHQVLFLLTLLRNPDGLPKIPTVAYKICYHSANTFVIHLQPLENHWILPLCCQLLEVRAIPVELERVLIAKSHGNPGWIEDFLKELDLQDQLKIVEVGRKESVVKSYDGIAVVNPKYIQREKVEIAKVASTLMLAMMTNKKNKTIRKIKAAAAGAHDPETRICLMKTRGGIKEDNIKGNARDLILQTYDGMNPNEQMLVKCASILGGRFSRSMLIRILPYYARDSKKYMASFCRLMESKIFRCASSAPRRSSSTTEDSIDSGKKGVDCVCSQDESIFDDVRRESEFMNYARYCYCRYTEFTREFMAVIIYDLMTERIRKDLHVKAAEYLETAPILCVSCGGPKSTYVFGFSLKATDFSAHLTEDPFRVRTRTVPNTHKFVTVESSQRNILTSLKIRKQYSDALGDHARKSKDKSQTQTDRSSTSSERIGIAEKTKGIFVKKDRSGLFDRARVYEVGSGPLAAIESDIFRSVITYTTKRKSTKPEHKYFAWRRKKGDDKKLRKGSRLKIFLRQQRDQTKRPKHNTRKESVMLPIMTDGDLERSLVSHSTKFIATSMNSSSRGSAGNKENSEGDDEDTNAFDFRGCECAVTYSKVCLNLVKHYKEAGVRTKSLLYLLEAVETVITIGSKDQALIYLDEAQVMLDDIKKYDERVEDAEYEGIALNLGDVGKQIVFLQGYASYEIGAVSKAKFFLIKFLKLMRIIVPEEKDSKAISMGLRMVKCRILRAKLRKLCFKKPTAHRREKMSPMWSYKLRALSYLYNLYKNEDQLDIALLMALWQLILAKEMGGFLSDTIPALCDVVEVYIFQAEIKKAAMYEAKALNLVKKVLGTDTLMDPVELLATATLFYHLGDFRVTQGHFDAAAEAAYISLRISHLLHDTTLQIHIFPSLIYALTHTLHISDVIESLQNHWFTCQSESNWRGIAFYYVLVLELINELCCPVESFYRCEEFAMGKDWKDCAIVFREYDLQFSFACSFALFYTRFGKWEQAMQWRGQAESAKLKQKSVFSIHGKLNLIQSYLITANFHQQRKRYQLATKELKLAKVALREVRVALGPCPVERARYHHMLAYYSKIRDRKSHTRWHLNKAWDVAIGNNNRLELEFIKHSRLVWSSQANPTVRYYWLENAEKSGWDKHSMRKIQWANVMYSLPAPMWT